MSAQESREQQADAAETPLRRSARLLWQGLPAVPEGVPASLTLDELVETAVDIADAEGLRGLSMKAVAHGLDVGTMPLLRIVPSREELLPLMLDAVSGPGPALSGLDDGASWREVLEAHAGDVRERCLTHPWLVEAEWPRAVPGPQAGESTEALHSALQGVPLDEQERDGALNALHTCVVGAVRSEIQALQSAVESGTGDGELREALHTALQEATSSGPDSGAVPPQVLVADPGEQHCRTVVRLLLDGLEMQIAARLADREP